MTAPCILPISIMTSLRAALIFVLCVEVSKALPEICSNGRSKTDCLDGSCGLFPCCRNSEGTEAICYGLTGPTPRPYVRTAYYSLRSTEVIIAIVVACLIVIYVLFGLIVCCVNACSSGTTGTVIQQTQNQPHVMVISTAQQSNYPMKQQPCPPISPGQAPSPVQAGCTNPDFKIPQTQPENVTPAYPPPLAGNLQPHG